MKKLFFLACMMLSVMMAFAQEAKRVAILEVVDKENKLTYSEKLMLRSNLARAVTNTEGYEAYNRSDLDAIVSEQDFQRSGNVSDSEIKKIGEMTGAAYILVAEGSLSRDGKIYVTAQIINVESGLVEVTDNALMASTSQDMLRGCRSLASKMFGAIAGASTSTNKFLQLFKPKDKDKSVKDSSAKDAEKDAAIAAREQQRQEEERIRKERAEAEERAKEQRRLEEERIRRERAEAEAAALEKKRLEQERKEAEEAERAKYFISRLNNHEFLYMNKTMNKKEYSNFLKNNCPEAFSQYKSGKKLIGAGWALFGVGLAATAGGGAVVLVGEISSSSSSVSMIVTGITILSVGSAMTVASIPMLGVGYSRCKKSVKTYNNKCASPDIQPLSLNLTAGQNGLGLALNF